MVKDKMRDLKAETSNMRVTFILSLPSMVYFFITCCSTHPLLLECLSYLFCSKICRCDILSKNIMAPAGKKSALITNKLFIRFTDRTPGHSSRLYFSAKPQIGHSVRSSYLDQCHSSNLLDLKQSLDIYVIVFCTNYDEF